MVLRYHGMKGQRRPVYSFTFTKLLDKALNFSPDGSGKPPYFPTSLAISLWFKICSSVQRSE